MLKENDSNCQSKMKNYVKHTFLSKIKCKNVYNYEKRYLDESEIRHDNQEKVRMCSM